MPDNLHCIRCGRGLGVSVLFRGEAAGCRNCGTIFFHRDGLAVNPNPQQDIVDISFRCHDKITAKRIIRSLHGINSHR